VVLLNAMPDNVVCLDEQGKVTWTIKHP